MSDYQVIDAAKDALLQYIKDNSVEMVLCDAAPANYSDATTLNGTGSGVKIATVTMVSGDYTLADATPDGRKITVAAKSAVPVVANGDGTHVAWLSGSAVLLVTKLSTSRDGLTTADTVNIPTHFGRVRDATVAA